MYVIKLIILIYGADFETSEWAQCSYKASHKREAGRSKTEAGYRTKEAEVGVMHSEDGGKGHEPKNAGGC